MGQDFVSSKISKATLTRRTVLSGAAAVGLSTVARADRIVVLTKTGSVDAIGTHQELLAREGWYRRTWSRQQAQEELSVL